MFYCKSSAWKFSARWACVCLSTTTLRVQRLTGPKMLPTTAILRCSASDGESAVSATERCHAQGALLLLFECMCKQSFISCGTRLLSFLQRFCCVCIWHASHVLRQRPVLDLVRLAFDWGPPRAVDGREKGRVASGPPQFFQARARLSPTGSDDKSSKHVKLYKHLICRPNGACSDRKL